MATKILLPQMQVSPAFVFYFAGEILLKVKICIPIAIAHLC